MDQGDLVTSIGNTLTGLDTQLMSPDLSNQPAKWQQLYAMRKHLDDQQRTLLQQKIASDDTNFKVLANSIQAETTTLNQEIKDMTRIDSIIDLVSEISSNLDQVLNLA